MTRKKKDAVKREKSQRDETRRATGKRKVTEKNYCNDDNCMVVLNKCQF